MDEHIGVLLRFGAAVIDRLGRAAILAFAVLPGVGTIGVKNIPAFRAESGDAVVPVGVHRAVKRPSGQIGCQFGDCNAKNLIMKNMIDTFLTVSNILFQALVKPFDNLAEEHSALAERIQELCVRALEKILREKVKDAVRQFRRGEDLIVAQVRQTVEHIGVITVCRHRSLRLYSENGQEHRSRQERPRKGHRFHIHRPSRRIRSRVG